MRKLLIAALIAVGAIIFWYGLADRALPDWPWMQGHNDVILHAASFAVLGLIALALWPQVYATAIWLFVVGIGVEVVQIALPARTSSLSDAAANLAGIIIALVLYGIIRTIREFILNMSDRRGSAKL